MSKDCRPLLAIWMLMISLVACAPVLDSPPEAAPRVMLEVDCGWQDIVADWSSHQDGRLVITDSRDSYTESHTFTGIFSPETAEDVSFDGKAIRMERLDNDYPPANIFVSEEEDYQYLAGILDALQFSPEAQVSYRPGHSVRIIVYTFEQGDESWNSTGQYYICADGIVLKWVGEEDGADIYYESLTPIDYYQVSALEIKYSRYDYTMYWECTGDIEPAAYRLCISDKNGGHRDFTLEEARDLLPSHPLGKNADLVLVSQINPLPPNNTEDYLKITEYSSKVVSERTYYLSPEGKLTRFLTYGGSHHGGDFEVFYLSLIFASEKAFDYDAIVHLLEENP